MKRAHLCTENNVCFGRIHGSQLREGANAGQHTPTLATVLTPLPQLRATIILCHNMYVWYQMAYHRYVDHGNHRGSQWGATAVAHHSTRVPVVPMVRTCTSNHRTRVHTHDTYHGTLAGQLASQLVPWYVRTYCTYVQVCVCLPIDYFYFIN